MASEPVEGRPLESVQLTFFKAPLATLTGAEPRPGPLSPSPVVGPSAAHPGSGIETQNLGPHP